MVGTITVLAISFCNIIQWKMGEHMKRLSIILALLIIFQSSVGYVIYADEIVKDNANILTEKELIEVQEDKIDRRSNRWWKSRRHSREWRATR